VDALGPDSFFVFLTTNATTLIKLGKLDFQKVIYARAESFKCLLVLSISHLTEHVGLCFQSVD